MKICLIHNEYSNLGGEEITVQNIQHQLRRHRHQIIPFFRSSAKIPPGPMGKARAWFSGIYSFTSRKTMRYLLEKFNPDVVHVHNVFPLISPSVLVECRQRGVPVVMTVHNYRLICPNGFHIIDDQVCEKCVGGKEYWCLLRNCEGSLFKSSGYAIRNWVARQRRFFLDNVTLYCPVTQFQRRRLIAGGFSADRIEVVPNMAGVEVNSDQSSPGDWVGFVGRVSPEKGISTLLKAAKENPHIPFKLAGAHHSMPELPQTAPSNVQILGHLNPLKLKSFYAACRLTVVPSIWFEAFALVLVEAMMHGKAVVCSRIGGLPEIVEDGVTGFLFEPGNAHDLAEKILYLWERPELAVKMGQAGREKAMREYSPEKFYERLLAAYKKAIFLGPGGLRTPGAGHLA